MRMATPSDIFAALPPADSSAENLDASPGTSRKFNGTAVVLAPDEPRSLAENVVFFEKRGGPMSGRTPRPLNGVPN